MKTIGRTTSFRGDATVMTVRTRLEGRNLVTSIAGEIDLNSREKLKRALAPLMGAERAVIDLSGVTYADATLLNGLAAVIERRRALFGDTVPLPVVGARRTIQRLFEIADLERFVRFSL